MDVDCQLLCTPTGYVSAAILGALLGSFANVCILRIPAGQSIVRPGSRCDACQAPIRWFDNVPILSFLWLRGRCRRCGASFSPRYLFVEAACAILVLGAYHLCATLTAGDEMRRLARFLVYSLFILALVVLAIIDFDTKKIPDKITYPAIPVFLGLGLLLGDRPPLELVIGVVAGYVAIRLISDAYYFLTKREGLGYGDGKLLALVGGLLGWPGVVFALFGGSVMGSLVAGAMALSSKESIRHREIPFGPYLAGGALLYLFLQDALRVVVIPFG